MNKNEIKVLKALVVYNNAEICKESILQENSGKCGIYRWVNTVNQKTYIGSAIDLRVRFYVYYSTSRLVSSNMAIYKAILKYGYFAFNLEILEYCDPDKVVAREQYYIDLLKPEYNLLKVAGSSLGFKHTEETLKKFKVRKLSDEARANLIVSSTGRVLSEEVKAKISAARKGVKLSTETREKLSLAAAALRGVRVEVLNIKTGGLEEFLTITEAANALGVSRTTIKNIISTGKVFRDNFIIKLKV